MIIYKYVVSSHPDNWVEGHQGACITELSYEFSESELVEDNRGAV